MAGEITHLVRVLTARVPVATRVGGRLGVHVQEPLLVQLQEAVRPSGEQSSGPGGAAGPGLPMDSTAFDLLREINREVTHRYWLVCSAARRRWGWTLPQRVEYWTGQVVDAGDPAAMREVLGLLSGWVTRIGDLFDPPVAVDLPRACPACGRRKVSEEVDGETVVNAALVATIRSEREPAYRVVCRGCGEDWASESIHALELATREPAAGE